MTVNGIRTELIITSLVARGEREVRVDLYHPEAKWSKSVIVSREDAKKLHIGMKVSQYETVEFEAK